MRPFLHTAWFAKPSFLLAFSVAGATLLMSWMTGWWSEPRNWQDATGWNRIPAGERPVHTRLADIFLDRSNLPDLQWLGHSGFIIRWRQRTLLLDPNVSDHCTVARRVLAGGPDPAELGEVHAALISHAHRDHLDLDTLRAVPFVGTLILPVGTGRYFDECAWYPTRFITLPPGAATRVGDLNITAVPAAHNGNRHHPWRSTCGAVGYVISDGETTLYYAGDTGARNDFAAIAAAWHPDVAILPIGAFRPAFPMLRYHLSPEQAVEVALQMGVRAVIPCHFGTYRVALDRPEEALPRFARAAHARGLRWLMPRRLGADAPGEWAVN
jgi:N-acyl-phosphatidylethanolamine-hydrolysing phospholipase D